jgi:predicted DNA-binding protein
MMHETLSIKVPKETKARLRAVARERRTKPSVLVREALQLVLESGRGARAQASLLERCADLFEDLDTTGPRDLASNPRHLANFGK